MVSYYCLREAGEMSAKTLIILGSPRRKGNSAALAAQVARGIEDRGGETETVYLNGLAIGPCQACGRCREADATGCILKDDMQPLYGKLIEADSVVLASPVYFFNVSAQLKTFIDRCYAVGTDSYNVLAGKRFSLVLTYADSDPFTSGAVNAIRSFQDLCRYVGAEIDGQVYGQADGLGEIVRNKRLMDQAYALGQKVAAKGRRDYPH